MESAEDFSAFGMHMVDGFLVVPVHVELDDDYVLGLRRAVLQEVKVTEAKGLLFDVSILKILDAFSFSALADTARMVSMLGADVVFVGFQPGVASALVDMDFDLGDVETAVSMDDGFAILRNRSLSKFEPFKKENVGTSTKIPGNFHEKG